MRRFMAFVLVLLLAACFEDPKLNAANVDAFNTSYAQVTKGMNPEQVTKFDGALKELILSTLEERSQSAPGANAFMAAALGAIQNMAKTALDSGWPEVRAKAVVENIRIIVDGRTANEILKLAADEKQARKQRTLALYREQLAQANTALADANKEVEEIETTEKANAAILSKVEITKSKFYYQNDTIGKQPIVAFRIANKSDVAIKAIEVLGVIQTPGRSVPWISKNFSFQFKGGLEKGEAQDLALAPNMFSEWGKVPDEAVRSGFLTLTLVGLDDPAGKTIGLEPKKMKAAKERASELQKQIDVLKEKISSLETET